jgi:hypothetical protein
MTHASLIRGALEQQMSRGLPGGGIIEFEFAPAGWLKADGEPRLADWRAYHHTPPITECESCTGSGRVAGKTAVGKKCAACAGTGEGGKRTRMPSVTTLLDAICPKPGIPPWSEARGIEGAVEAVRRGEIDPDDRESVALAVDTVRALRLGADRARDDAADRGLNVHALLQEYMTTGEPPNPAEHPEAHWGYIRALTRWLVKYDPEPVAIEQLVCHPEDGYAGRLDLRAIVGGRLITYDAKTQERGGIYSGAHLQVNLYERAAVRCGDKPADGLTVVVFDSFGDYAEMPADHGDDLVDLALDFYRAIKPIDSACMSRNYAVRKAREAAEAAPAAEAIAA